MSSHTIFRAYRYQILPLDRNETKDLYHQFSSTEITQRKNEFFAKALQQLPNTRHKRTEIAITTKEDGKNFFTLEIAPSRPLTRETADQRLEKVDNWPHIKAFILNNPEDQLLIIQDRTIAFNNTDTVSNMVLKGTRHQLEKVGLSLYIEPLFNESYFWGLVKQYDNRIQWVEFEFITPNMANISRTLATTLKDLGKQTNAAKEQLTLRADPTSSLDISKSNETINGLVDYTSQGTGDIKLKIKGIRKRFQTSNSRREVHLSGVELTADADQITQIIRDYLK